MALWAAVWLLFLLLRLSPIDVGNIPGAGGILLGALVMSVLAPIMAAGLAAVALVRRPRVPLNWVALACATAAFCGQALLFFSSRWL